MRPLLAALALLAAACETPEAPAAPDLAASSCGGPRAGPCDRGQACADQDGLSCLCNAYLEWMCRAAHDGGARD